MERNDVIVKSSITFKELVVSILRQIWKILRGIWYIGKYLNFKDLRHKWGWRKMGQSFVKLFQTAEIKSTLSIYGLVRSNFGTKHMANLIDDYLNCGGKEYREGLEVGQILTSTHPTLQGQAIRFALGIIMAFAKKDSFLDDRNRTAVLMCKKIAKMVEDGELHAGYYI
jgi:hypothetical protein